MLSFIELNKPHIDIELYGTDTNIAPIVKLKLPKLLKFRWTPLFLII